MPAFRVSACNYSQFEQTRSLPDFGEYADCVEYVNQQDCGDYTEGEWYYIPDEPLPDGYRVIFVGSFGNYNSPGADGFTKAGIYAAGDTLYEKEKAFWESCPEYLPSEDEEEEEPEEPEEGDYILSGCGSLGGKIAVSQYGKRIGEFSEWEHAAAFIAEHMQHSKYFPNCWVADDHGGYTLTQVG